MYFSTAYPQPKNRPKAVFEKQKVKKFQIWKF